MQSVITDVQLFRYNRMIQTVERLITGQDSENAAGGLVASFVGAFCLALWIVNATAAAEVHLRSPTISFCGTLVAQTYCLAKMYSLLNTALYSEGGKSLLCNAQS